MNKSVKNKKILLKIIIAALVITCAACVVSIYFISKQLTSQYTAERWRGENELEFSQISCFIPESGTAGVNTINTFRGEISKGIKNASLPTDHKLFEDCWSTSGSALVVSDKTNGTASVTAIGGQFFDFHPMTLLSGSYITEDDLMKDKVVLDEQLAWFLFGGTDLTGMALKVGPLTLQVGGVVRRDADFSTKKADNTDMRLYMAYETYIAMLNANDSAIVDDILTGNDSGKDINMFGSEITCYEVVLPNPVRNFAVNLVQDKFPIKSAEIKENTGRFSFIKLVSIIKDFSGRSIQSGIPYPYWENAARYAENRCSILLLLALVTAIFPFVMLIIYIVKVIIYGKTLFEDEYWPAWKDRVEEDVRLKQRAKWEKEHLPVEKQSEEAKALKTRKEKSAEKKAAKLLKEQQEREAEEAKKAAKKAAKAAKKAARKNT